MTNFVKIIIYLSLKTRLRLFLFKTIIIKVEKVLLRKMDISKLQSDPKDLLIAANRIQRVWRKYIDIQVFKYYKDLVIFHNEG
jgi:hypothetical protein